MHVPSDELCNVLKIHRTTAKTPRSMLRSGRMTKVANTGFFPANLLHPIAIVGDRAGRQKEVAERLGRPVGAVSQLEQGNVQKSVVDPYKLAAMFKKPIKYFLGEEYIGDDTQALIAMIRKMSPEERENQVAIIMMHLKMQNISETLEATDDEEVQQDLAKDFYKVFIPFSITVNQMAEQINDIKEKLEGVLDI